MGIRGLLYFVTIVVFKELIFEEVIFAELICEELMFEELIFERNRAKKKGGADEA